MIQHARMPLPDPESERRRRSILGLAVRVEPRRELSSFALALIAAFIVALAILITGLRS